MKAKKLKSWSDLEAGLSPEVRAAADQMVREDLERMLLAELRKLVGLTQAQLATKLGITQAAVSQIEAQEDLQTDTLRRIIEALGGEMEIVVALPGRRIALKRRTTGRRRKPSPRVKATAVRRRRTKAVSAR